VKTLRLIFKLASIITYALLLLSHSLVAVFGTAVLLSYISWLHLSERAGLRNLVRFIVFFVGFGVALTAFWYFPFIGLGAFKWYKVWSPTTVGPLNLEQLLGVPSSGFTRLAPWTVFMALSGGVLALRRRERRFLIVWSIFFVFYLVASRFPEFYFLLRRDVLHDALLTLEQHIPLPARRTGNQIPDRGYL
jgi:hypothetical protein